MMQSLASENHELQIALSFTNWVGLIKPYNKPISKQFKGLTFITMKQLIPSR